MADYVDHVGSYWPGYPGIENLVIFGDSYSSIGYPNFYPRPDNEHPLGSPSPAYVWTESEDKPNWVGHLVEKHKANPNLLVYNYAVGGDDVLALQHQIKVRFLPHAGKQPEWAPWKSGNSLFVTWIGINDCARLTRSEEAIEETQQNLFSLQQELYDAGSRNFLFIDIPPMAKSPAYLQNGIRPRAGYSYEKWNVLLRKNVKKFLSENEDITAMILSSQGCFDLIFENPSKHGFQEEDMGKASGPVWADDLHPTSRMHELFAERVDEFLRGYPASNGVSDQTS